MVNYYGPYIKPYASHRSQQSQEAQVLRENRGTVYEKSSGKPLCLPFYKRLGMVS